KSQDRSGNLGVELIAFEDAQGVREGRRVGRGGPRGNHIEWVTDHVGDNQTVKSAAGECLGQPAPFDRRHVFADAVHLVNGRAAGVQKLRDVLFALQSDPLGRRGQKGGAAAGNQAESDIVGTGV